MTATPGCGTQDATDSSKYTETLSDETAGVSRSCSATSAGGTTAVTTSPLIKIDKTVPSLGIVDSNTAIMDICNGAPSRPTSIPSDAVRARWDRGRQLDDTGRRLGCRRTLTAHTPLTSPAA